MNALRAADAPVGAGVERPIAASVPERLRVTQLVLSDHFAGTEGHVALLSRGLAEAGVHVRLVCGNRNSRLIDEARGSGVEIYPLALGRGNRPADWAAAHRAVVGWRPHIVHAHLGSSLLCGAILTALRREKLIFTQHFIRPAYRDGSGSGSRDWARALAHRAIHRRVDRALATTSIARREMVEHEGFVQEAVELVPLGIDVPGVAALAGAPGGDAPDVRAELGLPPSAALIVTPARLEREKGHQTLLEALPAVLARHPDTYALCAGTGALDAALREHARRIGVAARVRFLGQRTDVPRLLAQATLCVLPSFEEPFGLALLEAMAVGAPVVACDAGGPRDIVADGETGLLVPPGDTGAMARAITVMLADPARSARMGAAGRERVEASFSARRMVERTLAVYQRVYRRINIR